MNMPDEIKDFFNTQSWTFAKTYADRAPHEYIVRGKHAGTDEEFMAAVDYILANGITMYFWKMTVISTGIREPRIPATLIMP